MTDPLPPTVLTPSQALLTPTLLTPTRRRMAGWTLMNRAVVPVGTALIVLTEPKLPHYVGD